MALPGGIRRMLFRLYRLLWVDPKPTEISGSMAAFLWGLFMVVHWEAVAFRASYDKLLDIAPAVAWGALMLSLGLMQAIALVFDWYEGRRFLAMMLMVVWTMLFGWIFATWEWRPEVWFYLVFALGAFWTYVQLPIHRGR